MKTYAHNALDLLSRRRYGRRNFVTTFMGGNDYNRRKELAELAEAGELVVHPPSGNGDITRTYPKYFFRIYERPTRHAQAEQFWHQVLIDDILISIETACKRKGLNFTDRDDILKGRPFELPANISHKIDGATHSLKKAVVPDALFAIRDTYFVLEADTGSEPIERHNLQQTSYLRKFLQYRDILKNQTYKNAWGIPNMMVLNITVKQDRKQNLVAYLQDQLGWTSRSMLFGAYPALASTEKAPQPLLNILADPFERAGHPDFYVGKEVVKLG